MPIPILERMLQICDEEGLQKPSCYQGDYNMITRGMETKLLPLLRQHGIVFNAFRAMAAGFLTGNFVRGEHIGTRFDDENLLEKITQKIYGAENLHTAMKLFDEECTTKGLTTVEVALRWIFHYSARGDGDGVVVGASRKQQVMESMAMFQKGLLPDEVLHSVEKLWNAVRASRDQIL